VFDANQMLTRFVLAAEDLLPWEVYLKGFCIGLLIFGGIVIVLVLVTMGISAGHSLSHDFDHDVGTDMSIDKDISIDKDFSIDKGVSIDKDLSLDKDLHIDHDIDLHLPDHIEGPISAEQSGSAPLLLLMAIFSTTFGGLGLLLFWQQPEMNPYARLATILIAPILFSLVVDLIWRKIAISETYHLPTNQEFIGKEAVVMVDVDAKGGTIRVELPGQLEPLRVPAKSVHKHQIFLRDELVFIVGVEKNFYLVDNSRDLLEGKSKLQLLESMESEDSQKVEKNEEEPF